MTSQLLNVLIALGVVGMLTACEPQSGNPSANAGVQVPKVKLPPVRTAYEGLSARDHVEYVIAVQRALENPADGQAQAWGGKDGGTGVVAVVTSHRMNSGRICRTVAETINTANGTVGLNDVACWSGRSWTWLREANSPDVLEPLATYQVKRARSLRSLARRVKAKQADLKVLNPLMGDRIEPGTVIYLPRPG